jgi:AcrR family transcriptional regulator
MGARETNKSTRRQTILAAARALIRADRGGDFTMAALAETAGVSLATPYNLLGSKAQILMEIVREDIFEPVAGLAAPADEDLAGWVTDLARTLAGVYYPNRHFYRRMIVTLVAQESVDGQRAALDLSYRLFETLLQRLQDSGVLSAEVPAPILARHLAHSVSGSLQHRLMERGTETLMAREIETGVLLLLAGVCSDAQREGLLARLRQLSPASA